MTRADGLKGGQQPPRRDASSHVARAGFTLIELLLASALVTVVMVVLLSLTTSTAQVADSSRARMQSGGDLRGALDRLSADFAAGIFRDDLPVAFDDQVGNDSFSFTTAVEGYGGQRGISRVAYRIRDGNLERGAEGSGWTAPPLKFSEGTLPPLGEADFDRLAERVFRMEVDFLLADGTAVSSTPPAGWSDVRAIIVTLVTVDERALRRADGDAADFASFFPDPPTVNPRSADQWQAQLDDPAQFPSGPPPLPVLQGAQVRQRVFPIRR